VSSNCCPGFVYANLCSKNTSRISISNDILADKTWVHLCWGCISGIAGSLQSSRPSDPMCSRGDTSTYLIILAVFGIIWTFVALLVGVDPIYCQWSLVFFVLFHTVKWQKFSNWHKMGHGFHCSFIWGWGAANKNRKVCELLSVDIQCGKWTTSKCV